MKCVVVGLEFDATASLETDLPVGPGRTGTFRHAQGNLKADCCLALMSVFLEKQTRFMIVNSTKRTSVGILTASWIIACHADTLLRSAWPCHTLRSRVGSVEDMDKGNIRHLRS